MKKFIVLTTIITFSCSISNESKENTEVIEKESDKTESKTLKVEPLIIENEGLALIQAGDCRACHTADQKLVGPSYKEIAKKYSANYEEVKESLIQNILIGSSGIWGEIPMTAHPQNSEKELSLMLDYIMSLTENE